MIRSSVTGPRTFQRHLASTPGEDGKKAASGKPHERGPRKSKPSRKARSAPAPSQGRTESREQPQDLQDIERDIAAPTAEEEQYYIDCD